MTVQRTLILALLSGALLCGQTDPANERQQWLERLQHYQLQEAYQRRDQIDELARRREAQLRQWRFNRLIQQFITRWRELADECNTRGSVNPKRFQAVSKAFRELERSEGWLAAK